MHIAIEGCCHGELDKIYETMQYIEAKEKIQIELLICCGDFQAVRNEADLHCMAVPDKFKSMQDFWQYYAGKKTAPYLTLFIGGNHEASNYLQELPYGGWVAPNIYYMGYAGVVNYKGLRIGGLSGIFKQHDFFKGHYEVVPYTPQSIRSVYHIRNMEVFRLKQLKQPIDIMLSHDWPNGIVKHGDEEDLLRKKRHFTDDVRNDQLGSLPAWELLNTLRPKYWFAGHMHVKFAAKVEHNIHQIDMASLTNKNTVTRFLALDKCLPKRDFLQVINVDCPEGSSGGFSYDAEWLAVLKNTNELMSTSPRPFTLPTNGVTDYSVESQKVDEVRRIMGDDLTIPLNFRPDESCVHIPDKRLKDRSAQCKINQQTTEICAKLTINDPVMMLMQSDGGDTSFNTSSWLSEDGEELPSAIVSNVSINPDEIDLSDDDSLDDTDILGKEDDGLSENIKSAVCSFSAKPGFESDTNLHSFKTPIRLAANFSMNLPQPKSSTPVTCKTISQIPDEVVPPVLSPSNDVTSCENSESDDSCQKRKSSDENNVSMETASPDVRKFKRRNSSMYRSSDNSEVS